MAVKALMLRKKIDGKRSELARLLEKDTELERREAELIQAVEEARTEEEKQVVEEGVSAYEAEKAAHDTAKQDLEREINQMEAELEQLERQTDPAHTEDGTQRGEVKSMAMTTRKKFFGLDAQQRDAFLARAEVKEWLQRTREMMGEKRSVTGAELLIPEVVLDLLRDNMQEFSRLVNRVNLRAVPGKSRMPVMGRMPEAVWTEACASLNELDFGLSEMEVDGYKVGGYIVICKATLEDSDLNLASEILSALGAAIGIALDKAILFGTDNKMPLGIATRLAQTDEPSNYSSKERPWADLHTSNIITIDSSKHGVEFYQKLIKASAKAKSRYSRGVKTWVMNDTTYSALQVEAMSVNAAGAIVTGQAMTMPVAGGDIVLVSDDVMQDNTIIAGYFDLYLLAERAGAEFARSDDYRFAEDQVVFKGTARYDGAPAIAEAFVVIGLGAAPQTTATFIEDTANDTRLKSLKVGNVSLSPEFDAEKTSYTATVTQASDAVAAVPKQNRAQVEMTYDGKPVVNGSEVKWSTGTKNLVITVKNGSTSRTYTVAVTKAG